MTKININIKDLLEKHKGDRFRVELPTYEDYLTLRKILLGLGLSDGDGEILSREVFEELDEYNGDYQERDMYMGVSVMFGEIYLAGSEIGKLLEETTPFFFWDDIEINFEEEEKNNNE